MWHVVHVQYTYSTRTVHVQNTYSTEIIDNQCSPHADGSTAHIGQHEAQVNMTHAHVHMIPTWNSCYIVNNNNIII